MPYPIQKVCLAERIGDDNPDQTGPIAANVSPEMLVRCYSFSRFPSLLLQSVNNNQITNSVERRLDIAPYPKQNR